MVATGETRGRRKSQTRAIDPDGVDHKQRFCKVGRPLVGVDSGGGDAPFPVGFHPRLLLDRPFGASVPLSRVTERWSTSKELA